MSHTVIVSFGENREYEFLVHDADVAGLDKDQARSWLAKEFDALECTPSNPMGKVLALDMILNVAKYGGESRFQQAGEWARKFAAIVAVVLARPVMKVDVRNFTVG
ncbi:hypothetical protein J5J83_16135 [Azoarcus sp. L1K30]|uniref:hypothetical protein n=1 Tax=Azoarcus sp. L1K30 TaxID=2820277 RepID=UPI001B822379|nr:hypothetical protein [Azoarcus sp. L1K30]MBR0567654.1 hypothetical protein [Azoarcus sp. L1K30]